MIRMSHVQNFLEMNESKGTNSKILVSFCQKSICVESVGLSRKRFKYEYIQQIDPCE